MIAIGATVYLSILTIGGIDDIFSRIMASLFFGVGLFWVVMFDTWLWTGKIGRLFHNKPSYLLDLLFCIVTNFIGIIGFCLLVSLTRLGDSLAETAKVLVETKQNDTWYSILILSFLCGLIIYIAVKGYTIAKHGISKVLCCFLGVSVFIMCGFENVFANAAYYTYARFFDWKALLYFSLMILGNGAGAILFDTFLRLISHLEDSKKN